MNLIEQLDNQIEYAEKAGDFDKIPKGHYCYSKEGVCPYWSIREDKPPQTNGYCSFLEKGDWELRGSDLWDQVKECGENDESEHDEF